MKLSPWSYMPDDFKINHFSVRHHAACRVHIVQTNYNALHSPTFYSHKIFIYKLSFMKEN